MPRLLAVGHVTWDRLQDQQVLGGSVSYATLAARRLGWEAAALTSAGADFDPARDLAGVKVFRSGSGATTRFVSAGSRPRSRRARPSSSRPRSSAPTPRAGSAPSIPTGPSTRWSGRT